MREVEIETYGCSMNLGGSEAMAGMLSAAGFIMKKGACILVINTCTVKTPTENKIRKELESLRSSGKKIIVAGCLPASIPGIIDDFPEYSFLGTNISGIVDAVNKASEGIRVVNIGRGSCAAGKTRIRNNPVIGIVPISEGCLGSCSYCLVKNARGELVSYQIKDIVGDVSCAVSSGAKEIWLTSQDCGAYGLDIDENLPKLLKEVSKIEGDYMIRVGMMNPNHVKGFIDALMEEYRNKRVYKFLHIPVQSGDNGVLKDMNRFYNSEDFRAIIKRFREEFPDISISTDIIAGYPTEDEDAYKRTLDLIEDISPDVLNISRFWARPGTKAAGLRQLPGRVTNQRSREAAALFKRIAQERNKKWIGWQGRVLVTEKGKNDSYAARNYAYKTIILRSKKDLVGRFLDAKVTKSHGYYLEGTLLS